MVLHLLPAHTYTNSAFSNNLQNYRPPTANGPVKGLKIELLRIESKLSKILATLMNIPTITTTATELVKRLGPEVLTI